MAALAAITGYNMSLSKNEGCRLHGDLGVHPFLGVGDIIYTHVAHAHICIYILYIIIYDST